VSGASLFPNSNTADTMAILQCHPIDAEYSAKKLEKKKGGKEKRYA